MHEKLCGNTSAKSIFAVSIWNENVWASNSYSFLSFVLNSFPLRFVNIIDKLSIIINMDQCHEYSSFNTHNETAAIGFQSRYLNRIKHSIKIIVHCSLQKTKLIEWTIYMLYTFICPMYIVHYWHTITYYY